MLGIISNDISVETGHARSTFFDERDEYHGDVINLEDLPFISKLNNESSIEDATNRCFQRG